MAEQEKTFKVAALPTASDRFTSASRSHGLMPPVPGTYGQMPLLHDQRDGHGPTAIH